MPEKLAVGQLVLVVHITPEHLLNNSFGFLRELSRVLRTNVVFKKDTKGEMMVYPYYGNEHELKKYNVKRSVDSWSEVPGKVLNVVKRSLYDLAGDSKRAKRELDHLQIKGWEGISENISVINLKIVQIIFFHYLSFYMLIFVFGFSFFFLGGFKKIFISLRKLIRFRKMIKSGVTLCFLHSLVQLSTWRWTTVSASNNPPSVSRAQVMLQRSLGLWSPVANWMYLSPLKLFTVSIFNRYLHDLKSLYAFLAFQKIELSIKK